MKLRRNRNNGVERLLQCSTLTLSEELVDLRDKALFIHRLVEDAIHSHFYAQGDRVRVLESRHSKYHWLHKVRVCRLGAQPIVCI